LSHHALSERRATDGCDYAGIRAKVEEVLAELRLLEKGTLIASGVGETVYFDCACGAKNMRRAALLKQGQEVGCINPECKEKWSVAIEGDDIMFTRQVISVRCHACTETAVFPQGPVLNLKRNTRVRYVCAACQADNFLIWKLTHEKKGEAA